MESVDIGTPQHKKIVLTGVTASATPAQHSGIASNDLSGLRKSSRKRRPVLDSEEFAIEENEAVVSDEPVQKLSLKKSRQLRDARVRTNAFVYVADCAP